METNATKQRVVDALVSLAAEGPLDKISVGSLAARAGVSRQTFYYHFRNIYDVFLWAVTSKMKYPDGKLSGRVAPSPTRCVVDLCHSLKENRGLIYAFMGYYRTELRDDLRDYLYNVCRINLAYLMSDHATEAEIEIAAHFHVDGYIGIINHWLEMGMKEDICELVDSLVHLLKNSLKPEMLERLEENCPKPRKLKA